MSNILIQLAFPQENVHLSYRARFATHYLAGCG
jgi:hypothetical protein